MVHSAAASGHAAASATYAAGRPDYPPALASWLTGTLGLGHGARAIDMGAGTGKFTRLLAATGADVTAIEPVAEMRARLAEALPRVSALDGSATNIPLPDGSVDVLTCAQSFHWFASTAALDEFARVLRPGGRLGLIWNIRDENMPWVAALTAIMAPHVADAPTFRSGDWRRPFPHPAFGTMAEHRLPHAHEGRFARVVMDRILSVSFIAALPADEQAGGRAAIEALRPRHPELQHEAVRFPYTTTAVAMTRA